ncbi:Ubiquitin carboxyl-terminal hydrolase [Trichinella spiralis]|uniref:Ubiquitin carboxyl-terminal hydrolase n=1 Tax=Trichinella spiralis TaxID=6334 RepID=A0ABR3KHS7_TRISP
MGHFKVIKINIALLFAIILLQFISNASSAPKPFHKPKKERMPIAVKEHLKKLMENKIVQRSVRDDEDDIVAETKQVLQKSHDSFHHLEVTIQKLEEKLEIEEMLYDPWDKKDTSAKRLALEFLIRVAKQFQEELLTETGMMAGIQRQRKKCYVKYYMLDEYCATRKDDDKLLLKIERKFYKCQSHCKSTTKVENFYTKDLCVLKCFEKRLDKLAEKLGVPFDEAKVNAAVNKLETLDQSALPFTSI